MKNLDRMGVLLLMAHLLITLSIIALYGFTLASGQSDDMLKTILTVIIGYWFGSMGATQLRKPGATETTTTVGDTQITVKEAERK
jgi:hypothetical protein